MIAFTYVVIVTLPTTQDVGGSMAAGIVPLIPVIIALFASFLLLPLIIIFIIYILRKLKTNGKLKIT